MSTDTKMFRGWPAEALEFYEGLEADNSKAYWTAHKDVYETVVLSPMKAILAELAPEFGDGKVFRPNRDVRFSTDKSPYKTHIGATLGGGYLQLSANGLAAASGMHGMAPGQLDRYRRAVADDRSGPGLEQAIRAVERRSIEVHGHDSLKTVPKGYPSDHPRAELLRHKGLTTWQEWPPAAWLRTAAAKTRIADFLRHCQPLTDWLSVNVGPSD